MAKLECPVCGFRVTVPAAELKFGMACPACDHRRMGPPRVGPPPAPLGGIGHLPMEVVRPLAGAPMAALAAFAMLRYGGFGRFSLVAFFMLAVMAVTLFCTGVMALVRHRHGPDPRVRRKHRE